MISTTYTPGWRQCRAGGRSNSWKEPTRSTDNDHDDNYVDYGDDYGDYYNDYDDYDHYGEERPALGQEEREPDIELSK